MEGDFAVEKEVKKHVTRILCALCAVVLWLYVTYTEDPEMQTWIRNVPITYAGEAELSTQGITFISREQPETVNVKIAGRKSALRRLSAEDVKATVQYSAIGDAGKYELPVQITLPESGLRVSKISVQTVPCQTDVLATVEKTVVITSSGAEPLGIRNFVASPSVVEVTGPKGLLERLKAGVFVDLAGGDAAETYTVSLFDVNGERFLGDNVKIENDTVVISATRAMPIEIEAANVPENVEIREVTYTPETVDVRGELAALVSAEPVRGAYSVWLDFSASPAKSGAVRLVYPEGVEVLGPAYASAEMFFE